MSRQPARIERTLWEIAEAVWEEVEKVCPDKARALEMSNEILVLLVQRYARNVEIVSGRPGAAAACSEAERRGVRTRA